MVFINDMATTVRIKLFQCMVFCSIWILYASTYLIRKPLGVMKIGMGTDLHLSKTQLGWMDTAILLPYSLTQMLCSQVADLLGPHSTVTGCLFLSGLSVLTFGSWNNYAILMLLLIISGMAQAPAWPACCKCLAAWFPDNQLNTVFGIVTTSAYGGSIIATFLASYLQADYGWRFVFFPLSVSVMGLSLIAWLTMRLPKDYQIVIPGKVTNSAGYTRPKPTTWDLWRIPMVPQLSFAMMALKLVRYCVYLWLPVYLMQGLGLSTGNAGILIVLFDIGGITGSAVLGYVADKHASLLHTLLAVIASSLAFIGFLVTASWGAVYNGILLTIAGFCICGPDALLGGSVAVKIGEQDGHNAGAAVAGLINGFGSLGAVIEGPLVGYVSEMYGWHTMFLLIIACLCASSLTVLQAFFIQRRRIHLYYQLPLQNNI